MTPQMIPMKGKTFGFLTVIGERGERVKNKTYWLCRCECGTEKIIYVESLKSGGCRSCGCMTKKLSSDRMRKYGDRTSHEYPEYGIWIDMINRCRNRNRASWKNYGGRGITVCERWLGSFLAFLDDMGPRPSPIHSIDRYPDKDGNYEPGNCRWATPAEQTRNTRRNRIIEFNGERKTTADWAEALGISRKVIEARIDHYGWSPERALSTPILSSEECNKARSSGVTKHLTRYLTYQGETLPIREWAKRLGMSQRTLQNRINLKGWSVEKALTVKKHHKD